MMIKKINRNVLDDDHKYYELMLHNDSMIRMHFYFFDECYEFYSPDFKTVSDFRDFFQHVVLRSEFYWERIKFVFYPKERIYLSILNDEGHDLYESYVIKSDYEEEEENLLS